MPLGNFDALALSEQTVSRRRLLMGGAMTAALAGLTPSLASAASAGTLNANYAEETLKIGLFSGDISALAENKASHSQVKQFASLEYDEASAVGGLLLGAGASKPERPKHFADTLARLTKMDAGDRFDRMYLVAEIEGHQELLMIQKAEAASAGEGIAKTISTVLVPFIESHLVMLKTLHQGLRG